MPNWVVDWISDSLAAFFTVCVTDLLVERLNARQGGWLS